MQVHSITAFHMRTWNGGSSPKNMKRVILTFMLLHCNCAQPKAGGSNAVLSEQLRSPASHSCPPSPVPSHMCKSEVASCLLCTCSLRGSKGLIAEKNKQKPFLHFTFYHPMFPFLMTGLLDAGLKTEELLMHVI